MSQPCLRLLRQFAGPAQASAGESVSPGVSVCLYVFLCVSVCVCVSFSVCVGYCLCVSFDSSEPVPRNMQDFPAVLHFPPPGSVVWACSLRDACVFGRSWTLSEIALKGNQRGTSANHAFEWSLIIQVRGARQTRENPRHTKLSRSWKVCRCRRRTTSRRLEIPRVLALLALKTTTWSC